MFIVNFFFHNYSVKDCFNIRFMFYIFQNMVGEWQPPEGCEISSPPRDNPVVGHVVQRLLNMVYPPSVSQPFVLSLFTALQFAVTLNVCPF